MIGEKLERSGCFLGLQGDSWLMWLLLSSVINVISLWSFSLTNTMSWGTNRPPEVELKNAKGLSNENLQNLRSELTKLAAVRCGEVRTHRGARSLTYVHAMFLVYCSFHSGDDLWASGPHPGLSEWAQQASVMLLPWRNAEEPAEAAGKTRPGGAAEDGPTAQAGGGDG